MNVPPFARRTVLAADDEPRPYSDYTEKEWRDWADEATQKEIEAEMRYLSENYHNGESLVEDSVYDAVWDILAHRFPKSKVLKEVGAPLDTKIVKVALPYPMMSLNKLKPETAGAWIEQHPGEAVDVSDKEDGFSLMLQYFKGGSARLMTRGKGKFGGDITRLLPFLDVPKLDMDICIRCEGIISKAAFKEFSGEFENERNLLSSVFNAHKNPNIAAARKLHIIAYEIPSHTANLSPSKQKKMLKNLGFKVAWNKTFPKGITAKALEALLLERKTQSPYHIDGLVVFLDAPYRIRAGVNPDNAIAFKKNMEENMVHAEVVDIDWKVGKGGFLTPTIWIREVSDEAKKRLAGRKDK